ncbi:MAG: HAD family phosphatase [Anaerolineae bacterium]|nr:HAD family phosphatase [Anaerolineae bacterium]
MSISHVFFDLHGTIVDRERNPSHYARGLGEFMAERYGGAAEDWAEANRRIFADFDSYYTDLDLGADDCIEQMWEGEFRTTRALFRLTGTPEPSHEELWTLTRERGEQATSRGGDAFYPDSAPTIKALAAAGYALGTCSNALSGQVRGSLHAGGVLEYFTTPHFGGDLAGHFIKDELFFGAICRRVGVEPSSCLIVEDHLGALASARRLGAMAVHICRGAEAAKLAAKSPAHHALIDSLAGLPDLLN